MDNRPIGVFDSGLGGLTAVKELEAVLPEESIVYFGDTGRVPYGTRSRETVRRYAQQDMAFLLEHHVKAVLAACGTVSANAGDVGARLPVPYFDVVAPTAAAAAKATGNGKIGVIGTNASINSGAYVQALEAIDARLEVFASPCPLFVPLVENGFVQTGDQVARLVAERYLEPLGQAGIDTLILGCTHFPMIAGTIRLVLGEKVRLIDSGKEAALALANFLGEHEMLCQPGRPRQAEYYVSDSLENFGGAAAQFLGHEVEAARIDIESYAISHNSDF